MKKNWFSLFATMMAVVMCVGFTSCGDDDDEGGSVDVTVANLVGTWQLQSEEEYDEDGDLEEKGSPSEPIYVHFNADNTGCEYERDEDDWWTNPFTYTLNGNTLTYGKGSNEIVTLTTSQLVLKYTYSYGGWCIERYKKVSDSVIAGAK